MDNQSFAVTLERARNGDNVAMTALIEEYEPQIRRVARRRLGPAIRIICGSLDLVHSVHRSLIMSLRRNKFQFNGPQDLVNLAVKMTTRKAARKAARMKRENEIMKIKQQLEQQANSGRVTFSSELLHDLMETLNSFDRQLLTLVLERHSSSAIAEKLGMKVDSLRVHKSRLLKKLSKIGLECV